MPAAQDPAILSPLGIISLIGSILFLLTGLSGLAFGVARKAAGRWLLLFLAGWVVWSLAQFLSSLGLLSPRLPQYSDPLQVVISTILFYIITRHFLAVQGDPRGWITLASLWLSLTLLVDFDLFHLVSTLGQLIAINIQGLSLFIHMVFWSAFMIMMIAHLRLAVRPQSHPVLRNQAHYWAIALVLLAGGDILMLANYHAAAFLLCLPAAVLTSAVVTREYMPDIRRFERNALGYLVMVLFTTLVLLLGVTIVPPLLEGIQAGINPALAGGVLALLMAGLLSPIWVVSRKIVRRLIPYRNYAPMQVLQEYSRNISEILDSDILATLAIGLIKEAIEIQFGYLFIVDQDTDSDDNAYVLRITRGTGRKSPEPGRISAESPIAAYMIHEHRPLLQSELDLSPDYQRAPEAERQWFTDLKAEVYLPVYTKDEWIGLIALGPKLSGVPYLDEDLSLLEILADQTAIGLQNARLVESLMRVNNDFRRAYAAMEQANVNLRRANVQLENMERTKSDFISVASHELRTPLTVIRGYNEMLQEDATLSNNPYQSKLTSGISSGILRLHEIVNSMLDMASIDTRALQLQLDNVVICNVIQTVVDGLAEAIKERRMSVELESLSDLPILEGDGEALRKVFYNLITNAIKFTPDGGKVTVSGVMVSAGQRGLAEGGVEVIVADNGIGIDAQHQELIFSKFYQTGEPELHSSGKTKYKGSGPGLGLAISKGIIEAHHGQLWVESSGHDEVNFPGSAFHVILPLRHPGKS